MYKNKSIAVVVPAYDEEKSLGAVIDSIPDFVDFVIVVNDGSTDATAEVAKGKGALVLSHMKNLGVGAAFRSGLRKALELNIDVMVNIDADGQFSSNDIVKLIEPIFDEDVCFVTASRFIDPNYYPKMSWIKFLGNKLMSFLISVIVGHKYYDVSCGFRAYSREVLLRLNLFGDFTYTQETFLDLAFKKVPIKEIPIQVKGVREHGKSKVASNLFRYSYQTSKIILKTFRDYKPFKFFSIISVVLYIAALPSGLFLVTHFFRTGAFTPHKWAGFVSISLVSVATLTLVLGFILDMFARIRFNQEEILFYLKEKRTHDN